MSDFDSPWKEALDVYFEPFLALFVAQAHADIDWKRGFEPMDKEFQRIVRESEVGRRYVDKLVKVWLKDGREQWLLIHVEVQTAEEAKFARRMYEYNYRLFDRYNREAVSLAVLGDDNPEWRPDSFGYSRWGFETRIRFPVIKLLDYADRQAELEQNDNPFATIVLAHLAMLQTKHKEIERYARKVRLIKGLFRRGMDSDGIRILCRVIDWMIDLPEPLEIAFTDELANYEREKRMPYVTSFERVGLMRGMQKGLIQGRLEGIEVALQLKFGERGDAILGEIRAIDSVEKLDAILHAIKGASDPEELRTLWTT